MKKLLLSSLLVTSIFAFGYNQTALDNTIFLVEKGLVTRQSDPKNYRLDDYITRAELVGISLKLKWTQLPENYQCKKYFTDVTANDWICRAVEMAADEGIISRTNKAFNPQRNITRSESLSIILKASGLLDKVPSVLTNYIDRDFVFVPRNINIGSYLETLSSKDPAAKFKRIILIDILDWQFSIIQKWLYLKVIDDSDFSPGNYHSFTDGKNNPDTDYRDYNIWWFRESLFIRRDDAFKFMKNTYNKRELVSGEISL